MTKTSIKEIKKLLSDGSMGVVEVLPIRKRALAKLIQGKQNEDGTFDAAVKVFRAGKRFFHTV
ncbi:MAG: hypothetical protein ACREAE_04135 [Nitrosopumilaceae archaeon]